MSFSGRVLCQIGDGRCHAIGAIGNLLYRHGRFDAGQRTQDHGFIHIPQMPNSKVAASQWALTTCDGHLKFFACHSAHGFWVNAGRNFNGCDRR